MLSVLVETVSVAIDVAVGGVVVTDALGTKISKNRPPGVKFQFHAKPLHRFLRGHIRASELESQLLGCTTRKVMTFPSKGLTDLQGPGRARSLENYVKSSL